VPVLAGKRKRAVKNLIYDVWSNNKILKKVTRIPLPCKIKIAINTIFAP
jgi:hypothetical protein